MAGALVATIAVSGCGGSGSSSSAASPSASAEPSVGTYSGSPTAAASRVPSSSAPPSGSPTATARPAKDPTASSIIAPVVRNGKTPHPSVAAAPASLTGSVTYDDGVTLRVATIKQSTVKAQGPGEIAGPITTFGLRLTNGSTRSLDLSQVVVTLIYGEAPARIARPSYAGSEQDFAGTVKPGATASGRYSFAVPVAQRDQVVVHIDFDAVHAAAVFSGDSLG